MHLFQSSAIIPASKNIGVAGDPSSHDPENLQETFHPPTSPIPVPLWRQRKFLCIGSFCILYLGAYIGLLSAAVENAQQNIFSNTDSSFWNLFDNSTANEFRLIWSQNKGMVAPRSMNGEDGIFNHDALKLMVSFDSIETGVTSKGTLHYQMSLYLPNSWTFVPNNSVISTPYFTTSCQFGDEEVSVGPEKNKLSDYHQTGTLSLDIGNILSYPFEYYSTAQYVICSYAVTAGNPYDIQPPTGYLNIDIELPTMSLGYFDTSSYTWNATLNGNSVNMRTKYNRGIDSVYPIIGFSFFRNNLNMILPFVFLIFMWVIIIAETILLWPYYWRGEKVTTPYIPLMTVLIIIALPLLRHTLPGAPPVGAVMDYAVYFWCVFFSVVHFLAIAHLWKRDDKVSVTSLYDPDFKKAAVDSNVQISAEHDEIELKKLS